MKKIKAFLFIIVFILSSAVVFADDNQNASDQNTTDQNNATDQNAAVQSPSFPTDFSAVNKNMRSPELPTFPSGSGMMGETQKTVVATSDGGIVIVEGNTITKLDKDLNVTKSVELADTQNTGGDKNH